MKLSAVYLPKTKLTLKTNRTIKLAVFKNTDFRIDGEKTTYSLQIGRNMADETFTETDLAELRKLIDETLSNRK